jgi:hypothetical protein
MFLTGAHTSVDDSLLPVTISLPTVFPPKREDEEAQRKTCSLTPISWVCRNKEGLWYVERSSGAKVNGQTEGG